MALLLLAAGLAKLIHSGLEWASGETLQNYLTWRALLKNNLNGPGLWIAQSNFLSTALSWMVLLFELFAWLLLLSKKTETVFPIFVIIFFISTGVTMDLWSFFIWTTAPLLIFLKREYISKLFSFSFTST